MSQTKPETRCPVCGREFILIGSFWQCYVEDGDYHIISGPCNDPAGEKIDAMVRALKTGDERRERIAMALAAGMWAGPNNCGNIDIVADDAVRAADALIARLEVKE